MLNRWIESRSLNVPFRRGEKKGRTKAIYTFWVVKRQRRGCFAYFAKGEREIQAAR